ncbi:MAG: NAD(P)/FAD-dependent oxidoreductase, partial [Candidatus Bathycorpusculaceae bacterium]
RTEAERIIIENGKVKGVQADRGSIEAEKILVAAGAWTSEIMKTADVVLPIEPEKKEVGVTEPINYFIGPLLISLKNNSYVGQMANGEVIGSIDYPIVKGLAPEENTLDWFYAYADAASELVPAVKNLMLLRSWTGYYIMSPDNSHIMGRASEWPENLYVATGYSGHGFVMSHLVGDLMARNMLHDEVDYLMEPFLPSRFQEERLIKEEMVIG